MTTVRIGPIPWYRREDYARIKEVMEDGHDLPDTFDKWLGAAEKAIKNLERQGFVPCRVNIDPETFPAWCRASGLNVDSQSRIKFAEQEAIARQRKAH